MVDIEDIIGLKKWAVIGTSNDQTKFGHRIYNCLKTYGYKVYPVNSREKSIGSDHCYQALTALPVVPEVVVFVVPPAVALAILNDCVVMGVQNVWLQPGVNTPEVVYKAERLGLNCISTACALVETSRVFMLQQPRWSVILQDGFDLSVTEKAVNFLLVKGYICAEDLLEENSHGSAVVYIAAAPDQVPRYLNECRERDLRYIWLQPGSETEEALDIGHKLGLVIVHHHQIYEI